MELSYFKGLIPQGIGLVEFVLNVIKHREDVEIEKRVEIAKINDKVMWKRGVGAVGDISNNGFTMELKAKSEIYYHTFAEYFGMQREDVVMTKEVIEAAGIYGVVATPSPHSTYLVGDEAFRAANDQKMVSIHFMETPHEVDFFDKKGEMYKFVENGYEKLDFLQYGGHVDRLIESLRPDLKLLLVHNAQMKKRDIERVLQNFNDVTFALCPRSNYFIDRDFPPAQLLHDMGANVAIGTDSLASNVDYDIAAEIEAILINNPKMELKNALDWATRGGAHGINVENRLGEFKVGTNCGAVLIEGVDLKTLKLNKNLTSKRIV